MLSHVLVPLIGYLCLGRSVEAFEDSFSSVDDQAGVVKKAFSLLMRSRWLTANDARSYPCLARGGNAGVCSGQRGDGERVPIERRRQPDCQV